MFLSILIKRILPFLIAVAGSVAAYYAFTIPFLSVPVTPAPVVFETGSGSGSYDESFCKLKVQGDGESSALNIRSKPQAKYTDAARENNIEGSVRLRVTLLADGTVGAIRPVATLPDGLTEQAVAAARLIKFEPKIVNGVPVPTTITIDYSFDIY